MRKPTKTDDFASGLGVMIDALGQSNPSAAIERQEARGQQSFVASETLPTDMSPEDKQALDAAGVEFLGVVEDDPIFQYAKLPEGWEKRRTDHSMWSDLVDSDGEVVARIFYKAAFYDRSAHLYLKND